MTRENTGRGRKKGLASTNLERGSSHRRTHSTNANTRQIMDPVLSIYSPNGLMAKLAGPVAIVVAKHECAELPKAVIDRVDLANLQAQGKHQEFKVTVEFNNVEMGRVEGVHMWRRRSYDKALGKEVDGVEGTAKAWIIDTLDGYVSILSSTNEFLLLYHDSVFCDDTIMPFLAPVEAQDAAEVENGQVSEGSKRTHG